MRRALSASAGDASGSEGVSLAELERVAEEMGLPAEQVREAALALDARDARPRRFLFGVPNRLEEDRVVQAAITPALWEQIAGRLRTRYGVDGRTSNVGTAFEWRNVQADGSKADYGEIVVSSYRARVRRAFTPKPTLAHRSLWRSSSGW